MKTLETIRTYSELITIPTFEDRFEYLKLNSFVGKDTFGFDRIFNQKFYQSVEWKLVRNHIIERDSARDLGIVGREVYKYVYVHHMNPINLDDIRNATDYLMNPEYLICCSRQTHNAIHYGDKTSLQLDYVERKQGDTCPWK